MNRTEKILIVFSFLCIAWPLAAKADATCFCKASYKDLSDTNSASGVVYDFSDGRTFPNQLNSYRYDCKMHCERITGSSRLPNVAAAACSTIKPLLTPAEQKEFSRVIRVWSSLGTRKYQEARNFGYVMYKEKIEKVTYKCPAGWLSNSNNQDGGISTDGKCKKLSSQGVGMSVLPLPADGTAIGTYGFTWGNGIWAWGTVTNGGKPSEIIATVRPESCSWN